MAPLATIPGFLPEAGERPQGCVFADRCAIADQKCRTVEPALIDLGGRSSKCHYHERARDLPADDRIANPRNPSPEARSRSCNCED
jgi:hypothetical protein